MKLRALTIERLAGLRDGLELGPEQLDGRVRVLHGPNAIGKSSIVRALKALLWDEDAPVQGRVELEARFEIDGIEWTARRDGERTTWLRDGSPAPAPPLPAWSQASQMLVGLEDLSLGAEDDIQEHVQRELRGGFDLAAVETALRPTKTAGLNQSRALGEAERALRSARDAQDAVLREASKLDELRAKLREARAAAQRVDRLQSARVLASSRRELALLQAELDAYPGDLERLRGNEADELDRIHKRLAAARGRIADARREDARLASECAKLGLATPLATAVLEEIEGRIEVLRDADVPLRAAEAALAKARAREARAAAAFGPGADLDRLAGLDEGLDAELESFTRDASTLADRRDEIRAQIAALGATSQAAPPEARALAALEDWLSTPAGSAGDRRARKFLLVLAGILVVLAIALAFVHPAFIALAALAVAALYGARSAPTARGPTRAEQEAAFARTGEALPAAWNEEGVRARLDALRARSAEAAQAQPRAARRLELEALLAGTDAEARELTSRRESLAARLGTTVLAPEGAWIAVARAREELRASRRELGECAATFEHLTAARATGMAQLNAALRSIGVAEVSDLVAARVRVGDLRKRNTLLVSFQKDREAQIDLVRREQEAVKACEDEIAAVYRRCGLEPGDEAGLGGRLERLEPWKSARARRDEIARDVTRLGRDVDSDLAAAAPEWLDQRIEDARDAASTVDELASRVTQLETRLQLAQAGRVLEDALAERDACRAALETAFAKARSGALASALLADVRGAHEETSRPRLVEEAGTLFTRFTRNRYELRTDVVDGRLVLRARDAENAGRVLALDQLSDGTRAQLLLAARLAYLREIEGRNPLPVVLDDALATSDPERKREIGAALLHVAREQDRQFLVLTTDANDVDLLRPADARPGEVESTDLAVERGARAPAAPRERLRTPPVPLVPEPAGRDAEEYADALAAAGLRVRTVEPHREVDELHLWWVLHHDLALLHRLLVHHIDTVGSFRNAGRAGSRIVGERERAAAAPWIALAAGVLDAWRVGRGRPLDADVLAELGISERYLAPLISLAAELRWDAKAWLQALEARADERTRGYHGSKIKEHREALLESGHLDPREVLDLEEGWQRTLNAVVGSPSLEEVHELRRRFVLLWAACEALPAPAR